MESINGVTFEDYAAACANLAHGMPEEKILDILGMEAPVWAETMDKWNARLSELFTEDMKYASLYGEIFANPKVGKFVNVEEGGVDLSALLTIVPNYEGYQKIYWQQTVASQYGIDPVTVLEENGLDIAEWGTLNMHYMNFGLNSLDHTDPDYNGKFEYYRRLMDHWQAYWEQYYKENKTDLTSDINF